MATPDPFPPNAEAAINGLVNAVEAPLKDAVHGFLDHISKSSSTMSAQWVGNGAFQVASPSFTGIAAGATGVSATYTAVQADATGFTVLGKHYDFSTLGKGFSWKDSQSAALTVKDLGELRATVAETKGKVAKIQASISKLGDPKSGSMKQAHDEASIGRKTSAEVKALRSEIESLSRALGT